MCAEIVSPTQKETDGDQPRYLDPGFHRAARSLAGWISFVFNNNNNNNNNNNKYGIYIAPYTLCSMALHNSTDKNFVKNL